MTTGPAPHTAPNIRGEGTGTEMYPLLTISGLTLTHGSRIAVTEADLVVRPHQMVALVGPNGGGKTTLLRAVLGLIPPRAGTIRVLGGQPRVGLPGLGYVPQSTRIDPEFPLSVRGVVRTGTFTRSLRRGGRTAQDAVEQVLDRLNLADLWRPARSGRCPEDNGNGS
jgi:ABC-type Mn2+/Zn2+ transport system ATPase subunit